MSPTAFAITALVAILVVCVIAPLVSLLAPLNHPSIRIARATESPAEGVEPTARAHHTGTAR
jgi:hypothetical protein